MTTHWTHGGWQHDRRSRWVLYLALFVVALLIRLACFTGLVDSDDLGYSYFAQIASRGGYSVFDSHLGLRVGLTIPTGAMYALFGVGEFSTVLAPLLASSACVPLLVALGLRLGKPNAALIAGLLMLSFPLHIRYASVLVPETVVDFWILIAAFVYLHARQHGGRRAGVVSGMVFGIAYLTKEVALFVAAAFVLDALLQRRWRLFWSVMAGLGAVGAAELAAYALATGDPLFRLHVVQSSQLLYFADKMESARSTWRLFKEYPHEMLVPGTEMGVHSLVTLLLCAAGLRWVDAPVRRLLCLWAAVPFLYLNFGSASMSTYLPVAAGPRYVAIVYAPLFLIAGIALERWMQAVTSRQAIGGAILVVVGAVGVGCAYRLRSIGYHTEELGSLRSIAHHESISGHHAVSFAGPRAPMWSFSLRLLGTHPTAPTACLSIGPDAAGLPHVSGFVACPRGAGSTEELPGYPLK